MQSTGADLTTLGSKQYFGENSFLDEGDKLSKCRAIKPTRVICVERAPMLTLMSRILTMSDILVTDVAARRRRLLDSNESSLTLVGAEMNRAIREIKAFAGCNRIPFRSLSLG